MLFVFGYVHVNFTALKNLPFQVTNSYHSKLSLSHAALGRDRVADDLM